MNRSGRNLAPLGAALIPVVALLVMATCFGSPDDEPTPKGPEDKTAAAKKLEEAAKQKDAAFKAAEAYLILIDKGKYGEAWDSSSSGHRNLIPRQKWVTDLGKARRPFGRLRRRKLNRVVMRGAEDPEQIDQAWVYTKLETLDGFTPSELIIVYFDKAKEWKVSHYYIGDPDGFPKPPDAEKETKPEDEEKEEMKPAEKVQKKATKSARK